MGNIADKLSRALAGPGTVEIRKYTSETELSSDVLSLNAIKNGIDFKLKVEELLVESDSCYVLVDTLVSGVAGEGSLELLDTDPEMINQFLGGTLLTSSSNNGLKFTAADVENAAITCQVKFIPKSTKAAGKGTILSRCKIIVEELNVGMKKKELRTYKIKIRLLEPPVTTPVTPIFYIGYLDMPAMNPPTATTSAATEVDADSATLNGSVNPNGQSTTVKFEWGPTTAYGNLITAAESPVSGSSAVSVTAGIAPLTASTTYHCRVVAYSNGGVTYGADVSLATTGT